MRAFFNLIFFIAVLAIGGMVGYLYGLTGKPVPYVSDQLATVLPASMTTSNTDALNSQLNAQNLAIERLQQASAEKDQNLAALSAQLNQARAAAANAAPAAGAGEADPAFAESLIENNQFLTDELTRVSTENADLAAQLEAARANAGAAAQPSPDPSVEVAAAGEALSASREALATAQAQLQAALSERAQLDQALSAAQGRISELIAGAANGENGEQIAQLTQQVQQLAGERQNLITQLTSVVGQRDQLATQLQALGAQLQSQGVDVQSLFNAAQQAIGNAN